MPENIFNQTEQMNANENMDVSYLTPDGYDQPYDHDGNTTPQVQTQAQRTVENNPVRTVREAVSAGDPISLGHIAGTATASMIENGEARTLKEFEAQYVLARVLNSVNARRHSQNINPERDNIDYIPTSKEREYGKALEDRLHTSKNKAIIFGTNTASLKSGQSGYAEFKRELENVLKDVDRVESFLTDEAISGFVDEFESYTQAGKIRSEKEEKDDFLPISPFDPTYANHNAFLEHGGHILYAAMNEMDGSKKPSEESSINVGYYDKERLDAVPKINNNEKEEFKRAGRLGNMSDQLGLTPLLMYCKTKDEEVSVRSAFISYQTKDGQESDGPVSLLNYMDKIPDSCMEKALNILNYLSANGYSYTLMKDNNNGQVKAEIEGTNLDVRIMDLSESAIYNNTNKPSNSKLPDYVASYDYVGRVSDHATEKTIRLTPSFQKNKPRDNKEEFVGGSRSLKILPFFEPENGKERVQNEYKGAQKNIELLPVAYALNLPLPKIGKGETVNFAIGESEANSLFKYVKNDDPRKDKGMSMKSYTTFSGNTTKIAGSRLYGIRIESDDARARRNETAYLNRTEFMKNHNYEEYFKTAIESARNNFVQRMGLDGLVENARKLNGDVADIDEAGLNLEYDSDEKVAETQRTYWDILTGKEKVLLKPGVSVKDYNHVRNQYINHPNVEEYKYKLINMAYEVGFNVESPEEAVRQHIKDLVESEIGTYEVQHETALNSLDNDIAYDPNDIMHYPYKHELNDEKCFNPQNVLKFMDNDFASTRAKEEIFSEMLGTLTLLEGDEYSLARFRGNEHSNYQLLVRSISFDDYSAQTFEEKIADIQKDDVLKDNPKAIAVYKEAEAALKNAVANVPNCFFDQNDPRAITIDENGIIKYDVYRIVGTTTKLGKVYGDSVQDLIEAYKSAPPYNKDDPSIERTIRDASFTKSQYGFAIEKTTGYVGQIFNYDTESLKNGWDIVKTNFNGNQNYAFFPDKKAEILPQKEGESKSFPERLRVSLYENQVADYVYKNVTDDLLERDGTARETMGKTFSVNKLYYGMDAKHMPLNYEEKMKEQGLSDADIKSKLDAESSIVKLSSTIRDNADKFKEYSYNQIKDERGYDNDNYHSTLLDCDGKNRNIIDTDCAGYFDLQVTGNAENQGIKLFMVKGASIQNDGGLEPARNEDGTINKDARSVLMDNPYFANSNFNAADRVVMAINNYIDAESIAPDVGFVQMSFGGWGYDDGFVISKDFAEKFPVRIPEEDEDGHYTSQSRPRVIGDKMSDMSGNKGVIANIIDRNEPDPEEHLAEAQERYKKLKAEYQSTANDINGMLNYEAEINTEINSVETFEQLANATVVYDYIEMLEEKDKEVREALKDINHYQTVIFMRDNPDVDVIEAPYSHTSRQNGGTAMDALKSAFDVIVRDEDGNPVVKPKCAGRSNFNLLPQTADNKTHIYSDSTAKEGRKASSQLAWALNELHAYSIMNEFYGDNEMAFRDLKEYVNTFGLNFDSVGTLEKGFESSLLNGEPKYIFELPDKKDIPEKMHKQDFVRQAQKAFEVDIERHGGFLEIPFELSFPYGEGNDSDSYVKTPKIRDLLEKQHAGWLYEKYTYEDENGERQIDEEKVKDKYLMPVMSPRCRANTENFDGEIISHDFTGYYNSLFGYAADYEVYDSKERKQKSVNKAQFEVNKLANSVANNKFCTKNNIMKLGIMTKRRPNSATAVWSCNPYLPIDTITMSMETAHKLRLTKRDPETGKEELSGNGVILWRDPILHDGNVRYMKVQINNDLVGIQINGAMDKSFDGDFDGDTIGLVPLRTAEANEEAKRLLSVKANILNKNAAPEEMTVYNIDGTVYHDPDGNEVKFMGLPLMMNDGMDLAAGESKMVNYHGTEMTLAQKRKVIESQINMLKNGFIDPAKFAEYQKNIRMADEGMKAFRDCKDKEVEIQVKYKKEIEKAVSSNPGDVQKIEDLRRKQAEEEQTARNKTDRIFNTYSKYLKQYEVDRHLNDEKKELERIENALATARKFVKKHEEANKALRNVTTQQEKEAVQSSWNEYKSYHANEWENVLKIVRREEKNPEYKDLLIAHKYTEALKKMKSAEEEKIRNISGLRNDRFPTEGIDKKLDYYVTELSEYTTEAFEAGFAKHLISFESMKSHLSSIIDYMNDGAKAGGKPEKLLDYTKAIGIEVTDPVESLMDDNKKIRKDFDIKAIGTEKEGKDLDVSDIVKTGFTDQDRRDSQLAVIVKKVATGLSGSISQKGMAAMRRDAPEAVLEVTYAVTQAVLQVKHDPKDAARKFDYLQSTLNTLWDGQKIVKYKIDDNGNLTNEQIPLDKVGEVHGLWKPLQNRKTVNRNNHKIVYGSNISKVSREDFVNTFMAFYSDKEGLGITPNKEYVNQLADLMTIKGTTDIGGLHYKGSTNELTAKGKSFMDTFAYLKKGNVKQLMDTFKPLIGENLYGTDSEASTFNFTPRTVSENIRNFVALKNEVEKASEEESFKFEDKDNMTTGKQYEYKDIYSMAMSEGKLTEIVPSDCLRKNEAKSSRSLAQTSMGVQDKIEKINEKRENEAQRKETSTFSYSRGMSM